MRAVIFAALFTAAPVAAHAAITADVRDYAIASCLTKQKTSQGLQTEGYRLADVVLNRARVGPFAWKLLDNAVAATLARHRMVMVHVDGPVAQSTQPAILASCLIVIDDRSVRRAMARLANSRKR